MYRYALAAGEGGFTASKRWSVQLPTPSKLTTATFPHDAAIQSPVRIKGDRSLLHKYINRTMIALGLAVDAEGDAAPYVQVMLVDTVSGRLLHTATHSGCVQPRRRRPNGRHE